MTLEATDSSARSSGAQAVRAEVAAAVVSTDKYPRQWASFPDGVTGRPDLTYTSWLGYRPLKLDLDRYLPPTPLPPGATSSPRPTTAPPARRPADLLLRPGIGHSFLGQTPEARPRARRA